MSSEEWPTIAEVSKEVLAQNTFFPGQDRWVEVDQFIWDTMVPTRDPHLNKAYEESHNLGVTPNQGQFLHLLARLMQPQKILEIGALAGYSTIWLARALREGGHLLSLELSPKFAEVARANVAAAGLSETVEFRVGPALEQLPQIAAAGEGPFDIIFIDADKPNNPEYLDWAIKLSRPGTLIYGDNVVREGEVVNTDSDNPKVIGVRKFIEMLANDPRVDATAIQTVGATGYDGFAMAIVL
ncbi:O-methyltransferase [Streptomyces sp. NPDC001222]|uniref:O-methyltransferase n=1 Tax=Streptomyces sp. NPDC001222 TaxID=3364548 RepID=UPI00369D39B7